MKETGEATRASVKKEMAKPRMTKSAREGELLLGERCRLSDERLHPLPHLRRAR